MISSIEAPTSKLSNTTETGVRVSRNTHAPLRLPGMLSTAGHCDQSRFAMFFPLSSSYPLRKSPVRLSPREVCCTCSTRAGSDSFVIVSVIIIVILIRSDEIPEEDQRNDHSTDKFTDSRRRGVKHGSQARP